MTEPISEDRADRIEAKLDQLLAAPHAKAEEHEEAKLNRPSSVEEQVKAELERAKREDAAEREQASAKSEFHAVRDAVKGLVEGKPVAPQPRRQRLMWGKQ
jgi:hypothetical protein